jgi:DNA-binding transcriptional LysR family regulator
VDERVDLTDLRVFVVRAEDLHFGRAAARVHLSEPGLTYRIRRLESALGYLDVTRSTAVPGRGREVQAPA